MLQLLQLLLLLVLSMPLKLLALPSLLLPGTLCCCWLLTLRLFTFLPSFLQARSAAASAAAAATAASAAAGYDSDEEVYAAAKAAEAAGQTEGLQYDSDDNVIVSGSLVALLTCVLCSTALITTSLWVALHGVAALFCMCLLACVCCAVLCCVCA